MCKCSPYPTETKSHQLYTSTLKLRRKRTNVVSLYCCPIFSPNSPHYWKRMLKSNAFQHYLSKLASTLLKSQHFLPLCWKDSVWNMEHVPSEGHRLCTTLGTPATARHNVAEHVAVFGTLVLLAQIDGILSFETHLYQNWKCQYTTIE